MRRGKAGTKGDEKGTQVIRQVDPMCGLLGRPKWIRQQVHTVAADALKFESRQTGKCSVAEFFL